MKKINVDVKCKLCGHQMHAEYNLFGGSTCECDWCGNELVDDSDLYEAGLPINRSGVPIPPEVAREALRTGGRLVVRLKEPEPLVQRDVEGASWKERHAAACVAVRKLLRKSRNDEKTLERYRRLLQYVPEWALREEGMWDDDDDGVSPRGEEFADDAVEGKAP